MKHTVSPAFSDAWTAESCPFRRTVVFMRQMYLTIAHFLMPFSVWRFLRIWLKNCSSGGEFWTGRRGSVVRSSGLLLMMVWSPSITWKRGSKCEPLTLVRFSFRFNKILKFVESHLDQGGINDHIFSFFLLSALDPGHWTQTSGVVGDNCRHDDTNYRPTLFPESSIWPDDLPLSVF